MILPDTPLFNSKSDAEFRIRMIQYIKDTYQDLLGPDIKLLDLPNGLELVQAKARDMLFSATQGQVDLREATARKMAA
ncbi:MAG: hypothetical protein HQM10_13245 [Candidatus Riflebacteria bacterium]|nr:hypothetical protein [Candidatus Riflebacteria bacterium]